MNLYRSFAVFVLSLTSLASAAAPAEYDVRVQKIYASEVPLRSIAIAPVVCPAQLECSELETEIASSLKQRTKLRIVDAQEMRQLMEKAGVADLQNFEARMILGESLGVDAFALLTIKKAQAEIVQPNLQERPDIKRPMSVKLGGIELQVLARDGTSLAQASGETYAVESARSLTNMTAILFDRMLAGVWKRTDD